MTTAKYCKPYHKIQFLTTDGYCWVETEKILYLKAENKKTKLYLSNKIEILLDMNLNNCNELLTTFDFCYLNRSILINLRFVFQLIHLKGNRGQVIIPNGMEFIVSRRRKITLLNAMEKMTIK